MSIRFNHANNTMFSTDTINIGVTGGSTTTPKSIVLNSSSVIFSPQILPVGQAGAVVFDIRTTTLKYHNGIEWIEILSKDEINQSIQISLTDVYNKLDTKISTVTYGTNSIPSATINGTNLNILFPSTSTPPEEGVPGLFTSSPTGSIQYYSLVSAQTPSSIREEMSGVSGGQTGRTGTQASPYITKTGWTYADGNYWLWQGTSGNKIVRVPNLNNESYFKSMSTSGITKIDTPISGSGSITNTTISYPKHYHGTGMMRGLSGDFSDDAFMIYGKTWNDGNLYNGVLTGGDNDSRLTSSISGTDNRLALSTTFPIYEDGTTSSSSTHTHNLTSVDVTHFNVAVLYNIAEPSLALNQDNADERYVLKAGDVMTGTLTIATSATIQTNDTNNVLWFRNTSGGERAAIYHNSTNNTLRLRSSGGSEVTITNAGVVTVPSNVIVNNKNVVRSINSTNVADANGDVQIQLFTGLLDMTYIYEPNDGNTMYNIQVPVNCTKIIIISNCSGQAFLGGNTSHVITVNGTSYTGFAFGSRDGSSGHGYYASRPYPLVAEINGNFTANQIVQMQSVFNGSWNNIRAYTIYFKI